MTDGTLPRRTIWAGLLATGVALLAVFVVNLLFAAWYKPQFEGYTFLTLRSYDALVNPVPDSSSTADADLNAKATPVTQRARKRGGLLEQEATTQEALDLIKAACRDAELREPGWLLEEFKRKVKIDRSGDRFDISVLAAEPRAAATIANSLAKFLIESERPKHYLRSEIHFRKLISQRDHWESEIARIEVEQNRFVDVLNIRRPDENDFSISPEDFKQLRKLSNPVLLSRGKVAEYTACLETLKQLKDDPIRYGEDEVKRLEAVIKENEQEFATAEKELHQLFDKAGKGDKDFVKVQKQNFELNVAKKLEAQFRQGVDQLARDEFYFEQGTPAAPPTRAKVGRPVAAMLLFSALAIAIPFAVAFFLQWRATPLPTPAVPAATRSPAPDAPTHDSSAVQETT